MPNVSSPFRFYHAIGPFRILSHCKCPTFIPFLSNNIKVLRANSIPTSSSKGCGTNRDNRYFSPNLFLSFTLSFFNMVWFPLTAPGSWLQNLSNHALQMVSSIISFYSRCMSVFVTCMFFNWHRSYWKLVSNWYPIIPLSWILSAYFYQSRKGSLPIFGKLSFCCLM